MKSKYIALTKTRKTILILSFFIFKMEALSSCDCAFPPIGKQFDSSSLILKGKVLLKEVENQSTVSYQIQVLEYIKGVLSEKQITLYSSIDEASCGIRLELNRAYVIYADSIPANSSWQEGQESQVAKPNYSVSGCSRTTSRVDYELYLINRFIFKEDKYQKYFFSNSFFLRDVFYVIKNKVEKQFHQSMTN